MKKLITLLLLIMSLNCIAQASAGRKFTINFTLLTEDFKNTSTNFIYNERGIYFDNYQMHTANTGNYTTVTLTGQYTFIIGPQGFLATICLQREYTESNGLPEFKNYYIHFDSEIGNRNETFTADIGKIELNPSYPFIWVKNIYGTIKVFSEMSPQGWENIFLSEITNMIKIAKPE